MRIRTIILSAVLTSATATMAETVLLYEDFNADYTKSFGLMYDADGQEPHKSIASIFYSNASGTTMPWWIAKDTDTTKDKFIASHSYYQNAGTSNDWLISVPLSIDSQGYVLEFDAQCVNVRGLDRISDLSLFITNELLDIHNVPTEPTHVWHAVPYGNDPDNCEGDWTHYTYSLDDYAGQTVYVNFVNQNTDRDILCLDNVKVWRDDPAQFTMSYEPYVLEATASVSATVEAVATKGIKSWTMTLSSGDNVLDRWTGQDMAYGDTETVVGNIPIEVGAARDFTQTLTTDEGAPLTESGSITRMAFAPIHRVFFEETTSMKCGNCPAGAYNIESLLSDPNLGSLVVPVSVHIASQGYDPMATELYYPNLPVNNAAPLVFVDRNTEYDGFIPAFDCVYDPENPQSFAYRIAQRVATHTPIDISVDAQWVVNGNDTTGVKCRATVRPAYNIVDHEYRVAFVLTENNVGLDNNPYWLQDNYLSGYDVEGRCGGWSDLPKLVMNMRYHDVARNISAYNGHRNSLPSVMSYNDEYTYEYTMPIPDTYLSSNSIVASEAIRTDFCEVSAIVIDMETGRVVNAARVPMSDIANNRFTAADLAGAGVTDIITDSSDSDSTYYDLMGRPVSDPTNGIYVRKSNGVGRIVIMRK